MARRRADSKPRQLLDGAGYEPLLPLRERLQRAAGVYPFLTGLLQDAIGELDRVNEVNAQLRGKGGGDAERDLADG